MPFNCSFVTDHRFLQITKVSIIKIPVILAVLIQCHKSFRWNYTQEDLGAELKKWNIKNKTDNN